MITKCDSIGPLDVVGNQRRAVAPIQTRLLNPSRIPPVGPVNEAGNTLR